MTRLAAYAIAAGAAVLAGWLVPSMIMRRLVPSLGNSARATVNYRGNRVFSGLGLVWVVWAVVLLAASAVFDATRPLAEGSYGSVEMLLFDGPLTLSLYAVPLMLTVSAVAFGMVDDVFGSHADKGFRGHLRALISGRLTTGGLKLLGIGTVAAVYGWSAADARADAAGVSAPVMVAVWWILATMVIALSANLLNLLDLRPGRALKAYSGLAVVAGALFTLDAVGRFTLGEGPGVGWTPGDTLVTLCCLLVVLLGPVVAVWRFDLGEQGMLGDAGSNAMGAIVGYLLAGSLPLPWLAGVAVVLLGLNVLSERVSFNAVIESAPPLRWLDRAGRLPDEAGGVAGEIRTT